MAVPIRLRSFTTQLVLIVVFPIVILLTFVAYSSVSLHEAAMRTLVSDRDRRAVNAAAEAVTDRFQSRMLILNSLAERIADGKALPNLLVADPQLKQIFDGGLLVADLDGKVVDQSQSKVVWATNLLSTTTSWVLDHDLQPPLVVLNVQSSDHTKRLFGAISLANLNVPGTVEAITSSIASRLVILADDGHVIQDTTGQTTNSVNPQTGELLTHDMATHTAQSGQTDLVTVSAHVGGLNWTLVLQEPWAEVTNPFLKMSLIAPLAVIPALLLTVGILAYGVYSVVLPLRRLGQLAAQIAWGNYQMTLQSVGGVQEIRDLQATLNRMMQRLQESQNGIQSYIEATLQGQEEERKRLARDLHDDTLQSLIALNQRRQMAQRALERDPDKVAAHLDSLHSLIDNMIIGLRQLIRDMRPSYIEDLGLTPALEMLTNQSAEKSGLTIHFMVQGSVSRLLPNHELALYRITQEALNNVVRHAHATVVTVSLCFGNEIRLSIQDNGRGFDLPEHPQAFARTGHYGLMGIIERAEQIGGKLSIVSRVNSGTNLTITLPNTPVLISQSV